MIDVELILKFEKSQLTSKGEVLNPVMEESGKYMDERDPRKRKRSDDMRDHQASMSSSNSPKSRSSKPQACSDNWAQRAEAFIHKVNDAAPPPPPPPTAATPNDARTNSNYGFNNQVVGYPYPHQGYPSMTNSNSYSNSHYPEAAAAAHEKKDESSFVTGNNNSSSKESKRKSTRDDSSSSSSSSESEDEKARRISVEQRSKLKAQKEQYEKAQEKLEAQLIKLKEQREALKDGGAKHEDKIMKDNARLQKEVKNRLSHMKEVLDKINVGLDQYNNEERHINNKRNNSKRRETSVRRSKSHEYDEEDDSEREPKKKHKKKKKKYRSSSSSDDSDSDHERKKIKSKVKEDIPLDDSIFRMVSELKSLKSSRKGDETFMDLLGKMSEAYMKAKQDNNELSHRINALESENQLLKKQLEEFNSKDSLIREHKEEYVTKEVAKKWDVKTSHVIEVVEPKRKKKEIVAEIEKYSKDIKRDEEAYHEDTSRSVRAKMNEKEEISRSEHKKNGDEVRRKSKERSPSKERERRSRSKDYSYHRRRDYSPDRRNRYRDDSSRRRNNKRSRSRDRRYSRSRSKERRSSSRDSRSRSKDYREKSKPKEFKNYKDRNDRINLDEWADKPTTDKDPSLMSLKEKMLTKEKETEQQKKQWAAVSEATSLEELEPLKEADIPDQTSMPPRPQVAIQWGQGIKKGTPEPAQQSKKTQPIVGKMPWLQKGVLSNVPTPFGLLGPEEHPVPPPLPPPKKNPPKNPTPQAMDMHAMLAAAQAHMRARSEEFVPPEMEIPLPPLPAATDKDPDALNDTRPPKIPTPPPVREKTEMEIMIEKHCPGTDANDYTTNSFAEAPKISSSKFDLPPGEEDMDPNELAMLGIDPADLAGFGK
ncbi:unnamed protein product [Lepeophtheirus salmonis]|uniref:(salmon louse) hypothetical protein n=1 Tax=Lepeophtheirus salmonis TaxID=72036 RepID=A0A7R8CRA8_LEPSM|nr:unnamed protein product [Lepeophtheirus salmonis]CAF2866582.1 unnamed protein product [Lepeophtheirus salmonis]